MDAEIRRQQRRAENANRPRPITQVKTIGQRSDNGHYNLIDPDGGVSVGKAKKMFDARHDEGDRIVAIPRRDGVVLLQGPKAFVEPTAKTNPLALAALVDRCDGYLNGQIFNCGEEKRVITIAWAIGRTPGFGGEFNYRLINLITGEDYAMGTAPPATVPPCATPPTGYPVAPVAPPVDPEILWYQHVWINQSWATPLANSRCGDQLPVHPDNTGNYNESVIQLRSELDGTEWRVRTGVGAENGQGFIQNWFSGALSTISQGTNPPPIDQVPYLVLGNAVVGSGVDFNSRLTVHDTPRVYVSGNCPSVSYPGVPAPIDSRNPNGAPIPNTVDYSLSIGADGGPIGFIRHTPNCTNPLRWNSEKSYTIVPDANGNPQIRETSGRLTTDWRYGQTFPCRDTFRDEKFINISTNDQTKLWSIEVADRPGTLTPNTPNQDPIKITEKTIDPQANCTTTIGPIKEISPIVEGNVPFEIVAIAVVVQKKR